MGIRLYAEVLDLDLYAASEGQEPWGEAFLQAIRVKLVFSHSPC